MSLQWPSGSPPVSRAALKGKYCLITGAASGIGLAITDAFLAVGAYVTMVDIVSSEEGQKIASSLPGSTDQHFYVQCDVTDWTSLVQAFKSAIDWSPYHTLDVVVPCAGVASGMNLVSEARAKAAEEEPEQPYILPLQVNLIGGDCCLTIASIRCLILPIVYYTACLALHYFKSGRQTPSQGSDARNDDSKSLIFISSLAAYMDYTDTSYTTSKYGVRGLFRSIRARARDQQNVRCNNIAPWHIKTAQTQGLEKHFQAFGLKEGSGYTFVRLEILIEAVCQFVANKNLNGTSSSPFLKLNDRRRRNYTLHHVLTLSAGRSFAVMPEGYVDLKEDFEDGYAGLEVTKALQRRYDAGDQMYTAD